MNLTPLEIIRIGIDQGQPADVILASLEAAGWTVVRRELSTDEYTRQWDEIDAYEDSVRPQ